MQAQAVFRLTLNGIDSGNRDKFWATYWNFAQSAPGGAEPGVTTLLPSESERRLRDNFGPALKSLISLRDLDEGAPRPRSGDGLFGMRPTDFNIHVRGINYGSIEILLAILGGEVRVSRDREHGFQRIVSNDFRGS
jgi:hypothetical protein